MQSLRMLFTRDGDKPLKIAILRSTCTSKLLYFVDIAENSYSFLFIIIINRQYIHRARVAQLQIHSPLMLLQAQNQHPQGLQHALQRSPLHASLPHPIHHPPC